MADIPFEPLTHKVFDGPGGRIEVDRVIAPDGSIQGTASIHGRPDVLKGVKIDNPYVWETKPIRAD